MRLQPPSTGRLDPGLVRKDALIQQTIKFVWGSLLPWRSELDCSLSEAEVPTTNFFADHKIFQSTHFSLHIIGLRNSKIERQ